MKDDHKNYGKHLANRGQLQKAAQADTAATGAQGTELTPTTTNPYDLNGDGCVDMDDFAILADAFGSAVGDDNYNAAADFNGDGLVNSTDFNLWRAHLGEGCQ